MQMQARLGGGEAVAWTAECLWLGWVLSHWRHPAVVEMQPAGRLDGLLWAMVKTELAGMGQLSMAHRK